MLYFYGELKQKYKSDYTIRKLIKRGELVKIDEKLYSDTGVENYLEIIKKKYPKGVFTLNSAFYYYGLTDVVPERECLVFKRNGPKVKDKNIKASYCNSKFYNLGKTTLNVDGVDIETYDLERLLIELIRHRKSFGFDYYKEIINSYREIKYELDVEKIEEYIKCFAIEQHLYSVIMREVF